MKKKILLTGSEGFLGSHLKSFLKKKYHFISYDKKINGDIFKKKTFPKVDIVIHLAAFNSTKDFYRQPSNVIYHNIFPTYKLINFYKKKYRPLFIFAGTPEIASGAVSTFNYKVPTDEKVPVVISDLYNPRWSYAASKAVCEQMVIHSGLKFIIIRPHNVYGPRQKNHFIPEFVYRCKKAKKNSKIPLYGYKNTRSWLHVNDFLSAVEKILVSKKVNNEILNIGSNFEHKVIDVAKLIIKKKFKNKNLKILKKIGKKGDVKRRVPSIKKIKKIIKWIPSINIEKGLDNI